MSFTIPASMTLIPHPCNVHKCAPISVQMLLANRLQV